MIRVLPTSALAIAAFVQRQGAVYSVEILAEFRISSTTLRRRRPELEWLGIRFVQRGRGSFYAIPELLRHLPATHQLHD
jgi:hypothetical protein